MTEKSKQISLFGRIVERKEKQKECPYCHNFYKFIDSRHLIHCKSYRKNLPVREEKALNLIDSILMSSSLYLPKDTSQITLPNGDILDFIFVDGEFCGFLPQLSEALGEKYDTTRIRYNRFCKSELIPNIYEISYQKRITRKRLLRDFPSEHNVRLEKGGKSLILLREDDMIYLSSQANSKRAKLTTKLLINYFLKAKKWICDFIYKLGRCNNREFLFLCAWLRLGYALEEIEAQRWYRLPNTTRRVDFRLHEGEILIELDARELELHDPYRDKTTDRWFISKGKVIIRFMNSEIDKNPLKCVRETINITKELGIQIKELILPTFIKGFKKNKSEEEVSS